jgi:hypothetical protein
MKRFLLTLLLLCVAFGAFAQSKSVERFRNKHTPDLKLFFYKSTLKMYSRINLEDFGAPAESDFGEMPPLADLIKGIEKVKFFNYEALNEEEDEQLFQTLVMDVADEGYESLMSARADGANMQVFMKEKKGKPEGFVVLIDMADGFSILDIEGYPDVNNILKFSEFINSNSDGIGIQDAFN